MKINESTTIGVFDLTNDIILQQPRNKQTKFIK